jgi:transaldolase
MGSLWQDLSVAAGMTHEVNSRILVDNRHPRRHAIIKVPFVPYAPECFIVARDLEREGMPVNFTSTFSARQEVAAAPLCNVSRTNIFLGRLDQGLEACVLGAQVSLEAQRALRQLRRAFAVKTLLIVARIRNWNTFVQTAGWDVYTVPVNVLRDWMKQDQIAPEQVTSRLDQSYSDHLGISDQVLSLLGTERIARLYDVEPSFIDFLQTFGSTREWRELNDAETLFKRFEEAGYGDMFYSPRQDDWAEIRGGKVPDLNGSLTQRLPLDTLYSLLADADFEKHQEEMDDQIARHIRR